MFHIWRLAETGTIYYMLRNFRNHRPEIDATETAMWASRAGASTWARRNLKGKEYMVLKCRGAKCPMASAESARSA